jgi:hypothetical protein
MDYLIGSTSCDDLEIFVEYFQFLNLLHIALRHVTVADVQPFQLVKAQENLGHDFSRYLVGNQAKLL